MSNHIAEEFTAALLAVREQDHTQVVTVEPVSGRIERLTDLVLRFLDWVPSSRCGDTRADYAPAERLAA